MILLGSCYEYGENVVLFVKNEGRVQGLWIDKSLAKGF